MPRVTWNTCFKYFFAAFWWGFFGFSHNDFFSLNFLTSFMNGFFSLWIEQCTLYNVYAEKFKLNLQISNQRSFIWLAFIVLSHSIYINSQHTLRIMVMFLWIYFIHVLHLDPILTFTRIIIENKLNDLFVLRKKGKQSDHHLPIRNLFFGALDLFIWCHIYCYKFAIHWLWCLIVYIIVIR